MKICGEICLYSSLTPEAVCFSYRREREMGIDDWLVGRRREMNREEGEDEESRGEVTKC